MILPAKPPFRPRQFRKCAVVGNSGDLLKTEFGKEIDEHDAVIRDNEAPVNEVATQLFINMSTSNHGKVNSYLLCGMTTYSVMFIIQEKFIF